MKKILGIIAMLVLFFPLVALAADFRASENANIGKSESLRNLYTAGKTVTVDANINGDLVAAGANIDVNGNVENSFMGTAANINIRGNIGGNARVAGGTVTVDGNIGEDLVIFSGQVIINSSSTVSGDLIVYGGSVNLNGKVNGYVYGSAGTIYLNGMVGRNVNINNAGTVNLGESAVINGDLNYSANKEATVESGATVKGATNFTKITNTKNMQGLARLGSFFFFATTVGSFLLLLLIAWLAPKSTKEFVTKSFDSTWANLGIGFVVLIAAPVLMLLLALTVFGIPIAGFSLTVYGALVTLAGVLSILLVGSLAYKLVSVNKQYEISWKAIGLGVVIFAILKLIPILGWLVLLFFFLIAFGGLTTQIFRALKAQK